MSLGSASGFPLWFQHMALSRSSRRLRGIGFGLGIIGLALAPGLGRGAAEDAKPSGALEGVSKGVNHWAYRPPVSPTPPIVSQKSWPRSSVDTFILASMEGRRLKPAPDADPLALCRRIHFDLSGLPPSPEDLEAFRQAAAANRNRAIADLVDRLLACLLYTSPSPRDS